MKKIICLAAALLLLALALTGCHKHVSAAPATCTEPCLLYTSDAADE